MRETARKSHVFAPLFANATGSPRTSVTRSDGDMPKHEGRFDTLHSVIEKLVGGSASAREPFCRQTSQTIFGLKHAQLLPVLYKCNRRLRHAMEGRGVGGKGSAVTEAEG